MNDERWTISRIPLLSSPLSSPLVRMDAHAASQACIIDRNNLIIRRYVSFFSFFPSCSVFTSSDLGVGYLHRVCVKCAFHAIPCRAMSSIFPLPPPAPSVASQWDLHALHVVPGAASTAAKHAPRPISTTVLSPPSHASLIFVPAHTLTVTLTRSRSLSHLCPCFGRLSLIHI